MKDKHASGGGDKVIQPPTSFANVLRQTFTWLTIASLIPIAISVIGSGYIAYRYNEALGQTRARVAHSLAVNTAIDDLLVGLLDAETGQRGYLITGDDAYLDPYRKAAERLDAEFADLRNLVADNTAQVASLDQVADLYKLKLAELGSTIKVRQSEGFDAARKIVSHNKGKDTMDRIRDRIDAMRQRESALLTAYTKATRETEARVVLIVAACVVLSVLGRVISLIIPPAWNWSRSRKATRALRK